MPVFFEESAEKEFCYSVNAEFNGSRRAAVRGYDRGALPWIPPGQRADGEHHALTFRFNSDARASIASSSFLDTSTLNRSAIALDFSISS